MIFGDRKPTPSPFKAIAKGMTALCQKRNWKVHSAYTDKPEDSWKSPTLTIALSINPEAEHPLIEIEAKTHYDIARDATTVQFRGWYHEKGSLGEHSMGKEAPIYRRDMPAWDGLSEEVRLFEEAYISTEALVDQLLHEPLEIVTESAPEELPRMAMTSDNICARALAEKALQGESNGHLVEELIGRGKELRKMMEKLHG